MTSSLKSTAVKFVGWVGGGGSAIRLLDSCCKDLIFIIILRFVLIQMITERIFTSLLLL